MGYHVAHEAGVAGSWPDFSLNRKPTGYSADARRSTHPIAEDAEHLVDVDTAFTNFDMITYAKGASVLHQLVIWLGWDTFVKGTNVYLTRHRFGNAELADYLEALDSVTDRDVRGWAEAYLRTTGFDTIRVTRDGDVPVLERDGSRPHRFSVAALDGSAGSAGSGTTLVDLGSEPMALTAFAGSPVLPNAADETYAAVLLDDASWQALVDGLSQLSDPLLRSVAWSNAFTRVRSGLLTAGAFMDLVEEHLGVEKDPVVFASVLRRIRGIVLPQWTAPEALAAAQRTVAGVCTSALDAGDRDRGLAAMRGLASSTVDATLLRSWLETGEARPGIEIDRDTRWVAVRRLVILGEEGSDLVAREAAADRSSSGYQASLTALASRPDPAAKADAWSRIVDPTVSNRDFDALVVGLWTPGQEALCAPYLDSYLADAPRVAERSQSFAADIAYAVPQLPMAVERLAAFRDRLDTASTQTDNTVLRRGWRDRVDDYDVALRVRRTG
jgi:aminopeptidase N